MNKDKFINFWQKTDFSQMNAPDIRETFITPFLDILGYSNSMVKKIIREDTLSLNNKFLKIGSKRVKIDYVPTIRLKKLWIIEAKGGNVQFTNEDAFLQASFYAIHPEIQAKHIVLINGWEIRVYDAYSAENLDDAIIMCDQTNCESTFDMLFDLLSAETYLTSFYSMILKDINKILEVEIDKRRFDQFHRHINRLAKRGTSKIRKNLASYYHQIEMDNDKTIQFLGQKAKSSTLLGLMNAPLLSKYPIDEYFNRIKNGEMKGNESFYH